MGPVAPAYESPRLTDHKRSPRDRHRRRRGLLFPSGKACDVYASQGMAIINHEHWTA